MAAALRSAPIFARRVAYAHCGIILYEYIYMRCDDSLGARIFRSIEVYKAVAGNHI